VGLTASMVTIVRAKTSLLLRDRTPEIHYIDYSLFYPILTGNAVQKMFPYVFSSVTYILS
jgi:hypothetical protein